MKHAKTLTPVDISELIITRHRAARAMIDELSRVAKTLVTAGPAEFSRALRLTRKLYEEVRSEIALEASVLLPALRDADAWGKIRGDKLVAQLRKRRKELRSLRTSAAKGERTTLGAALDRFIDGRRVDMARAERDTLSPGILRDDVLGVDVNGG